MTLSKAVEFGRAPVEVDPTRMCELLVGLPDVTVLGVVDGPGRVLFVHIETRDPRRWSRKSAGLGREGVQTVASPMPGKVVRVLIAPGDEVAAGQGLVVVEAMKMQNEMKAVRSGKVRSVAATEGATVAAGEVLATIE